MKKVWPEEIYKKVNRNDLILVSLFRLESSGQKPNFEKLLKQCFDIFPQRFGLSGYHHLPDSRKLDRPLRTLRARKMIKGNPRESFSLSVAGRKRAFQVINLFRQKKLSF